MVLEDQVFAGVGYGCVKAGIGVGNRHAVGEALQDVHAGQHGCAVERGARLAGTAAKAVDNGFARIFRRFQPAARFGARADHVVEVHDVAGVDAEVIERGKRLAHVEAAVVASEGYIRRIFYDNVQRACVAGADGRLGNVHLQRGFAYTGFHQRYDLFAGKFAVELASSGGFCGEHGPVGGDRYLCVDGCGVDGIVDFIHEGIQL